MTPAPGKIGQTSRPTRHGQPWPGPVAGHGYSRPMAFRRSNQTTARSEVPTPEQTLLDLVNGLRDLTDRVDTVERRFDIVGDAPAGDDNTDEVMDLRLQVARLSAELSRVAVELNARIVEVAGSTGIALSEDAIAPIPTPNLAGDESFGDLTADSPARARSTSSTGDSPGSGSRTSGWQPTV